MRTALALVLLVACTGAPVTDEADVAADGAADAADPSVRAGDTTLSVSRDLVRRGDAFVLRGKTSRTLTGGSGFTQVSARVFEVTWAGDALRSAADGADQILGLEFGSRHLAARVVVRPRLGAITGSSKVYLTAELTPVVVDGLVHYRLFGHTTDANSAISLRVDGLEERGVVARADDHAFTIDLSPERALALTAGQDLDVLAFFQTGGVEKHAKLGLAVKTLGMTTGDPVHVWPHPSCTATLKTCLGALPGAGGDTGACGDAVHVLACAGVVGVTIDDVAMQSTLQAADTRIATLHDDAVGLVDAVRADAWLAGAHDTVEQGLGDALGRWLVTPAARTRVLAAVVEAGIDTAYARPLDLVMPAPVVPGDAAAMRQVAADAVLAQLATMNFVDTDFGATLEGLAHDFRAMHVASIRAFRETITPEPYPGVPTEDVYIGEWLGAHTEVVVVRATGALVSTLVELD
jgi:hypothetical protein